MSTEKQKMLSGELYDASDPELSSMRVRARELMHQINNSPDKNERDSLLRELIGHVGGKIEIEPPFYCDYGANIYLEGNFYANFGCVILDCAQVRIGEDVMFGPSVQVYAAHHPIDALERIKGPELASPITIGRNVWVGGSAIIVPGVTIGENTTIGAGSVVTKDVPANVVAVGNPARVIRRV
jgi:maltose O-acetyltransferase